MMLHKGLNTKLDLITVDKRVFPDWDWGGHRVEGEGQGSWIVSERVSGNRISFTLFLCFPSVPEHRAGWSCWREQKDPKWPDSCRECEGRSRQIQDPTSDTSGQHQTTHWWIWVHVRGPDWRQDKDRLRNWTHWQILEVGPIYCVA